ncbi:cation transporter [Bacillus sp. Bva_UNVM-123]|uniref:heavy-metal-associated domain-containing protein n=1 Tax=Bacillus sp. Bva_UNVM-123 TaxID=2829798 RepID=UPI00391EE646
MKTANFQLEPLTCPSCIKKIESTLNRQSGVLKARVLFHSSKVKIDYDESMITEMHLQQIVFKLGYPVLASKIVG